MLGKIVGLTLLPTMAWAHPGHHAFETGFAYLTHLLGEPDHVALLLGAGMLVIWMRSQIKRRKTIGTKQGHR